MYKISPRSPIFEGKDERHDNVILLGGGSEAEKTTAEDCGDHWIIYEFKLEMGSNDWPRWRCDGKYSLQKEWLSKLQD